MLRRELTPAMGCTEPAAIGLAAAAARYALDGRTPSWLTYGETETGGTDAQAEKLPLLRPEQIGSVEVILDRNVYKNAFSVGVPNSGGQTGIEAAAALGVFSNPELRLNLFADNCPQKLAFARALQRTGKISVTIDTISSPSSGIFISVTVKTDRAEGKAVIRRTHTGIEELWRNGAPLYTCRRSNMARSEEPDITQATIERMIAEIKNLSREARALLLDAARTNLKAGFTGLRLGCGLGVGYNLDGLVTGGSEPPGFREAVTLAAAASDARMSGQDVPVVTSCGSGNQGIVSTVPILVVAALASRERDPAQEVESSVSHVLDDSWLDGLPDKGRPVEEALGISQAVSYYSTYYEGILTPLCGCIAKAGLGAAAGLTYLQGGNAGQISASIKLMAANVVGALCDGAKISCALKCATAAGAAIQSSRLAMRGVDIPAGMGIVGETAEQTIKNVGELSKAMTQADNVIVRLISDRPVSENSPESPSESSSGGETGAILP